MKHMETARRSLQRRFMINTAESAKALFLSQTSALVSRPLFYVFHKEISKNIASIGTSPWDESCKNRRKVAAGALNRSKTQSYEPLIVRETTEFLQEAEQESQKGTSDYDFRRAVQRLPMNV